MADDVAIRPHLIAAGAARWQAASGALEADWARARAAILALSTERTWGADGPGAAFAGAFLQDGGPAQVLFGTGPTGGQNVVTATAETGPAVTQALTQLVDVDQDGAAGLAPTDGA